MAEELDRFSLILGPGEKIEEPKPPKKKKKKTKARLTNGNPRDLDAGPNKRRGRPKKIKGQFVYLLPDGKCTTEVPNGKNDTVVRFGYIVPPDASRSDSAQFVTMRMDVDGFDTEVMTEGVVQSGDVMVMLRGGEMEMYRTNGARLDYNTFAGNPYGAASRELEYEEEPEQNEVNSMLDMFDEY